MWGGCQTSPSQGAQGIGGGRESYCLSHSLVPSSRSYHRKVAAPGLCWSKPPFSADPEGLKIEKRSGSSFQASRGVAESRVPWASLLTSKGPSFPGVRKGFPCPCFRLQWCSLLPWRQVTLPGRASVTVELLEELELGTGKSRVAPVMTRGPSPKDGNKWRNAGEGVSVTGLTGGKRAGGGGASSGPSEEDLGSLGS